MSDYLKRLPAQEDGKDVWVTPGGLVEAVAATMEEHLIDTARTDARRALTLCADETVSPAELRMALRFSVAQLKLVADIAQDRFEERNEASQRNAPARQD